MPETDLHSRLCGTLAVHRGEPFAVTKEQTASSHDLDRLSTLDLRASPSPTCSSAPTPLYRA